MPSGPRKRKAQRRKKEEREKELEKEKQQKDKEEVKEKLNSPTTSSSSQDFNHSKKDIHYNEESSKDDSGSSSSSCSSSEEDGEKKKGAADGGEDEAAVGEVKVAEEIEIEIAIEIAIEKRVVPPVGDGAEAVPDVGADKPFDVLTERDDKLSHESAERAVLLDPSDCPPGESIREEEELCCRESEETEVNTQAAPAPLLEHRTAWWNCCGMLDVFAGSKSD